MFERVQRARTRTQTGEGGFTLIELLIVIVILGILSAIVVFAVGGITDKGDKSACKSDQKTVEVASEAYYAQNSAYAPGVDNAGMTALKNAKLIRSVPDGGTKYTIHYDPTTGAVTATGSCTVS